ncbi:MAG: ECF transporter S component [Zhaonellaceae bacterium]|nr:ECF transporter S component [Clostridia bacterium]
MSTKKLVNISLLSVLGFLLMFTIEFPLPFLPPFLKYDPSEVPALIAAFAWGPWTGVLVEFIKTFLFFMSGKATSGLVGATAAFLAGGSFVFVGGLIYEKVHTKTGAVISLIAGSIAMTVVMTFANYFVLLPLWGISQAEILPLVVSAVIPFNLAKAIISSVATFVVYKRVHYWLEKQIFVKSSKVKG